MSDASLESRLAAVREFAQTSPYYQAMGMSLAEVAEGRVVLRVVIQDTHLNADGIVHGGVLLAEGRVVQSGRRLSFAEVEIREESSGKPVARGSGVFVIDRPE
ncbi:MAG: PaaI family thioesterase [Chloroflexi bacterium]|nr:PaaI family thioesterase [Chloroflexota bacterium]